MDEGRLFVVTGPSGVGKGTLIARLLEQEPQLKLSVSATTRRPRYGEVPGRDYHFLSEEEFERRVEAGDFIEHASYSGRRYGTLRSEVEPSIREGCGVVLEIEVQGARQVRERMPGSVRIFIAPPTPETLRERLVGRGTNTSEEIDHRLEVAHAELAAKNEFRHVIVNAELATAVAELASLVRAEMHQRTG